MRRRLIPRSVEELADWYMRYISPLSLIAGFVADNLILLRRVDVWTSNAFLFFYLTVAALCIILLNVIESGRLRRPFFLKILPLIPVVAQFAFGGLFSGYLSLYSRSAAYAFSWIFVIILAALLIGNERFVRFYRHFTFQMSVYFGALFSFYIFFLPVVFHQIGPWMFIVSGATSVIMITLFIVILSKLVPEIVRRERTKSARSIAVIFVAFNILYFTNVIPPLPLALKDAGVYHSVKRVADTYILKGELVPWYESYLRYNVVFHRAPKESVYLWSAVFAPSSLETTIFHQWQKYDDATKKWKTISTFSFPILGGRDGGYRGYSVKNDTTTGNWRVNVITEYGQIVGQVSFRIEDVPAPVPLVDVQQ